MALHFSFYFFTPGHTRLDVHGAEDRAGVWFRGEARDEARLGALVVDEPNAIDVLEAPRAVGEDDRGHDGLTRRDLLLADLRETVDTALSAQVVDSTHELAFLAGQFYPRIQLLTLTCKYPAPRL